MKMKRDRWKLLVVAVGLLLPLAVLRGAESAVEPVKFGRDVLPILAGNCFSCHGPDEKNRKAGLRLDLEETAKAKRRSGVAILPGQPEKSLILERIGSSDPEVVMPPPGTHRQVTPEQVATLRRWIAEGAVWGRHWSFEPVVRPAVVAAGSVRPIDALVGEALARKGLKLQPAASPQTLVRRLWLDLIGLPPTPEVAERFAANPTPEAWERMVDDLLARPQFGEHWARMWLDLARYADTKGYEKDMGRTIWPYRDWVIGALNADMPLDRFTAEQLAGDLLPQATESQLIATAFHRNTMTNDEGGTDNEEFRVAAVKDRIDTTVQVWMGLTMGCAKCHTHKYDPISHREYYSFYALFNQTEDADRYDDAPTMEMLTPAEKVEREELQARINVLNGRLAGFPESVGVGGDWWPGMVEGVVSRYGSKTAQQSDGSTLVSGINPPEEVHAVTLTPAAGRLRAVRVEFLPEKIAGGQQAVGRSGSSNLTLSEVVVEAIEGEVARPLALARVRADYAEEKWPVAAAIDGDEKTGWAVEKRTGEAHVVILELTSPLEVRAGTRLRVTLSQMRGDSSSPRRFRVSTSAADPAQLAIIALPAELRQLHDDLTAAFEAQKEFNDRIVRLPVMKEMEGDKRRVTKIHVRGNFLEPGEEVSPGVPAAFHSLPAGAPANRLGVARWLVDRENPLTPRVWANRVWARLFGVGIVETEEDFGAQGSSPTNQDLLDWLAAEYRDGGWSLKRLVKTIVLSETYRQSSVTTPALREADPRNLLLSRGARFRLGAEAVRDQSLAVAGLLSLKAGGAPVMPPQPAGLWRSTYNKKSWIESTGEDRYRRGIYTYLKRTTPYPSMVTFDGGSGEVCQIRRLRTNTPLQALVTLNDPVYLEAAGGLARRMALASPVALARASAGLRLALIRSPRSGEAEALVGLHRDAEKDFTASPAKADELIRAARIDPPAGVARSAFAAWIVVANAILNLDEFLSRN